MVEINLTDLQPSRVEKLSKSKKNKHMHRGYVGLSVEELQALSGVSGEAVRLYWTIASFAYGDKVIAHPRWSVISERMGKTLDPRNGRRLAKQLEDAGLVSRGKFGDRDRWKLVLKEKIIQRRQGSSDAETTSNEPSTKGNSDAPIEGSNLPDINKTNKRIEINNNSNEIKSDNDFPWTDSNRTTWDLEALSAVICETNGSVISAFSPSDQQSLYRELVNLNKSDPMGINPKSMKQAVSIVSVRLRK